ncbi:hypothetical protein MKW94_011973 [Papaver nudicaule]|uniref:Cytochrome P450 n=1 Tax=Papaver nudicaule TaxID=74823 RepID=A0AA41W2Q4_PAPNU|nr:hypothetical protein [Papaver nudicaule]
MIMINPNVGEKIYNELITFEETQAKKVTGYDTSKSFTEKLTQFANLLDYDSLGNLSYLHATINETLRLYPAVPQV